MEFEISGDIQLINEKELIDAFYTLGFRDFKYFEGDYFVLVSHIGKLRVSQNGNSYMFSYNIEVINEEYAKKTVIALKGLFIKLKTWYIIELYRLNGSDNFEMLISFRNWGIIPPSNEA